MRSVNLLLKQQVNRTARLCSKAFLMASPRKYETVFLDVAGCFKI